MPICTFRSLTQPDELLLWEMLYQALFVPEGQKPFPKNIVYQPELAKYVEHWGKESDFGYVAIEQSTLQTVGVVWARLFPGETPGYGFINKETPELSIAVLPGFRNQGIGTQLLDKLIGQARHHFRAVSLSVSADNPAVRLYERFGFERTGHAGSSITMIKIL